MSTTFLVQNQRLSSQTLNASTHDNARVATERMASELRSVMDDGFIVAGARTLTVRSPIVLASVCDTDGSDVHVHMEGGAAELDTDEVAGVALRDAATGAWTYATATWSLINGGSTMSASSCAANGADTSGATSEFQRLLQLPSLLGSTPTPGDVLMLFRESTFKIQTSDLQSNTLGLFRQASGSALTEFATGIDTTAQFQYRTGGTSYADTVSSSSIGDIDAVRIVAEARLPARSGGLRDATFGWSVNVLLRNVP